MSYSQASLCIGFSRHEYWSGLTCPPPGDLPGPEIEPASPSVPTLQTDSLLLSHQGNPQMLLFYIKYALVFIIILICKVAGFFRSQRYTFAGQAEPFPWASRFGTQLLLLVILRASLAILFAQITFSFLKWECIFGMLSWESGPTVALGCDATGYFNQHTMGLASGSGCCEYSAEVTAEHSKSLACYPRVLSTSQALSS